MALDLVRGKEIDTAAVDTPVGTVSAGAGETNPNAGAKRFWEGQWYYFCSQRWPPAFRRHTG